MGGPRLATERLVLRPLTPADVDALHELWMHPDVRRFVWDGELLPRKRTAEVAAESEARRAVDGTGLWLAFAPSSSVERTAGPTGGGLSGSPSGSPNGSTLVGYGGYWPFHDPPEVELLYGLGRDFWGRGLATELARALLVHGFGALGFDAVQASVDAPNQASIRVLERLGMRFERRDTKADADLLYYRLRADDFALRAPA